MTGGRPQPAYKQKENEATAERQKSQQHEDSVATIAALNGLAGEIKITREKQEASDSKNNIREWVGVIGIYLAAGVAFWAINSSSRDSHEQWEALTAQVNEMRNQRLLGIQQTRANLRREPPSITSWGEKLPNGVPQQIGWAISPQWKNVGSTNATAVVAWFEMKAFDLDAPELKQAECPIKAGPSAPIGRPVIVSQGGSLAETAKTLSMQDAVDGNGRKKFILLWGHIEYRDIYPETPIHHDNWCIRLMPNDLEHSIFSPLNISEEVE